MSLLYGTLGYLIGILIFISAPFLLPNTLSPRVKQRVSEFYYRMAARAWDRILFDVNRHGDASIQPSRYSDEKQADVITRDDEDLYFDDSMNNMSRLYNYPLGLASSEYGKIISPIDVLIAEGTRELAEANELIQEFQYQNQVITAVARHVKTPTSFRLFDLRDITPRLVESFEPNDPEKAEEDMRRSQEGYKSRSAVDIMIHVVVAGIASVLAWLIWSNSAGSSSVSLPDTFGMLVGVVV